MALLSCSIKTLVLLVCVALVLYMPVLSEVQVQPQPMRRSRRVLELENHSKPIKKKTNTSTITTSASKNQTKLIAKSSSTSNKMLSSQLTKSNQTKLSKAKLLPSYPTTKNKTKLVNPNSSPKSSTFTKSGIKSQLEKRINSTSLSKSIKKSPPTPKKSTDLTKTISSSSSSSTPKNKTAKASKTNLEKDQQLSVSNSKSNKPTVKEKKETKKYSWVEDDDDDEDDLISGFRNLPSKFQESLLPDLERLSKTSKVYLNKANKEITNNFKPIVGKKYAPTIASLISIAFIFIPLILVSLIFNKIKAYFSLQKLLIFIQIYLSIYFTILCLSSLVTGLEPLKFFYATAQSTYICLQVLQTLAYVLYLLMLLMYLVLVFSTDTGPTTKFISLGQTFVGFAVGLHYYMTVFHRAVLHQPPKTSWKVHAIYAVFFMLICISSSADTRKKAYLVQGGEVEKKS